MQRVAVDLHRSFAANPRVELASILLRTNWRRTGIRTGPFLLSLLRDVPNAIRAHRAEVVLFSSMVTASVVPLLQSRINSAGAITAAIPVGRDVTLPNRLYQRWVPRVLRSLDLVLPISQATAGTCLSRGSPADRLHVVPCGIDLSRLGSAANRGVRRGRLLGLLAERGHRLPPDPFLILSVGRHQERKGFHWFVEEVMPHLRADTVYLVAGSGPTTSRIARSASRLGLDHRVLLLGQVPESLLEELYGAADVFVMPNVPVAGDIEGFGVVMLEAGAAGLPVVAADLEGIRDVIADGINGRLVPSLDAQAFARAIDGYRDTAARETASEAARRYVRGAFGWDAIVERYLQIVQTRLDHSAAIHNEEVTNPGGSTENAIPTN